MTGRDYLQHGSRHTRKGSDPVPGMWSEYLFASFNSGYDTGNDQSVGAGTERNVQWYSMETSNQTVFATHSLPTGDPNNAAGDKFIQLLQGGIYFAMATLAWETGSYSRYCYVTPTFGIGVSDFTGAIHSNITPDGQATSSTSLEPTIPLHTLAKDMLVIPSDYVPGAIKVMAGNLDSSAHDVVAGTIGVYYFGGADMVDETSYTVY